MSEAPGRPVQVALVTCAALPSGDDDDAGLVAALGAHSIEASWVVWNEPKVQWGGFALTVVRSPWDYTGDREAFLRWSTRPSQLCNSVDVLAWNSDKSYLRDLARAGIPIVPTQWVAPRDPFAAPAGEFVLKPTVGAGSIGAGRFDPRAAGVLDSARAHLNELHAAGRTVMVQPYLADVDDAGEAGLIYLDGTFSHAITKLAMLPPATVNALAPGFSRSLFMAERISAREANAGEIELGDRVLAYVAERFGRPLYARVDLLPTQSGAVVIEVELTEPSLFFDHHRGSRETFAAAIASRLARQ